jgi:hypothetical protein
MEIRKKEITVYVSKDGIEFLTETKCKKWEKHLVLDQLHKNLIKCNFHSRCKIQPYFHNYDVKFIGSSMTQKDLDKDNSYRLVMGRMGNGDDRVKYRFHGSTITMIKYYTHDDEQDFLCSIPANWVHLYVEALQIEVDEFIQNRKLYRKVVNNTSTITYEEI